MLHCTGSLALFRARLGGGEKKRDQSLTGYGGSMLNVYSRAPIHKSQEGRSVSVGQSMVHSSPQQDRQQ